MSAPDLAPYAPGDDPTLLPAAALSDAIAARRLSPVTLVEALLARIAAQEPTLRAFTEVHAADAPLAAEAADKAIRSGHALGPLHGIPVALKDLVELEGRVVAGGSAIFRGRVATRTATIARRMVAQGMIVLGKTHTVEFAHGGWGTNQHMGTPHNPWDPAVARTPGGSSSGSGVAVAARMAPWAIGTDTGGSVRLPASFCGITGLKATIGRISTHGVLPLSATLDRGVRGLRLGRMPDDERADVDPEVLAAYDRSLDLLGGLGAEIVPFAMPRRFADYVAYSAIMQAEAYALYGRLAEDPATPMGDVTRRKLLAAASITARDYLAARALVTDMKAEMARAMDGIDAVLTPTTLTAAIPLSEVDEDGVPSRFTRFVNLLEMCALSLPNGFTAQGLPCSLQVACRGWDEALALRIGQAAQRATDWHLRTPPGLHPLDAPRSTAR
ncbi:MAG: amidase [Janthinobacterium lividum]